MITWLLLLAQRERKRGRVIVSSFNSVSPKKKEAAEKPAGTYIVTADNMASVFDFEIEEREEEMTY